MTHTKRCVGAAARRARRHMFAALAGGAVAWGGMLLGGTTLMADGPLTIVLDPGIREAWAQPKPEEASSVKAEIIVLHATNEGKGIDKAIGELPALKKPPFSAYDTYRLLEKKDSKLEKGRAAETALPNGGALGVTFKGEAPGKKKRYLVSASIKKAGGDSFLPLLEVKARPGEKFFVAGQPYKGGILVIGIRVTP